MREEVPTDGALVCAAYRRWGTCGFARAIGDWSIVLHDSSTGAVVLASDYLGIRPLYYSARGNSIRWSHCLETLVANDTLSEIDERYVAGFLLFGGYPNRTPYADVQSVPPGHAVSVTMTGASTRAFWHLPTADTVIFRDERRYDEQFRHLFSEAVAVRLATDTSVLIELSGGLDSSSVACMAAALVRTGAVATPRIATITYTHRDSRDLRYLREVEQAIGVESVQLSTHEHPLTSRSSLGAAAPEPWAPVHTSVAAVARRLGASTVLTGQHGDLATSNYHDDSLQVASALRSGRLTRAVREAWAWSTMLRVPVPLILRRALQAALPQALTPDDVYATDGLAMAASESSVRHQFLERVGVAEFSDVVSASWKAAPPGRRKHFRAFTMMRELRLLQRPQATPGLDYTHPFARRPLAEFLMSVPADVMCRPGEPRRLMRRALRDLWPPALQRRRSKSLFNVPWSEALKPMAVALLDAPQWHIVDRGWVDADGFRSRLRQLSHGLDGNQAQLRQLIMLEYWLQQHELRQRSSVAAQTA